MSIRAILKQIREAFRALTRGESLETIEIQLKKKTKHERWVRGQSDLSVR